MIRETKEADLEEVLNLIYSAFGNQSESGLARQLILDEDLLFNIVFESSDVILGNVVVSKITMEPDAGLLCGGVAPLSVLPQNQSTGIGSQLMRATITKSKELNIDALFLLGYPSYYKRFDFKISNLPNDYSVEHFQELELTKNCLNDVRSKVIYANAFTNL